MFRSLPSGQGRLVATNGTFGSMVHRARNVRYEVCGA